MGIAKAHTCECGLFHFEGVCYIIILLSMEIGGLKKNSYWAHISSDRESEGCPYHPRKGS